MEDATGSARKALITGIAGQDGWYLTARLCELGYSVVGTSHRPDAPPALQVGSWSVPVRVLDLGNAGAVDALVHSERPDEIYNLAARASSAQLFDDPLATADVNGVAVARLLDAIRRHSPGTKFCQASSREVFAGTDRVPQDETTARTPLSAYGAAKAFADHLVAAYRSAQGLFACSAILYSHESPRRSSHFLVRKLTQAAARARAGKLEPISIGDLDAVRDWGYAPDYVEAMRRMLRQPEPRDYLIATGIPHTVRDVCEAAFGHVNLDWQRHVRVDDKFKRPPDRVHALGNAARARAELDWHPSLDFEQMIVQMVEAESV
jgi:GDPmannose 4,6-dehydratase